MTHGKILHTLWIVCFCAVFSACSPQYRLRRILKNHPDLTQLRTKDSTVVRFYRSVDTALLFTQKTDTIHTEHFTIWRTDSTIRIRGGCPPCTTQITQPERLIQTTRTRMVNENRFTMREWLIGFIGPFLMFLCVLLLYARSKRSPGH